MDQREHIQIAEPTEGKSLGPRFLRGVVWSLVGAVASRILAMVVAIVTARLLGRIGFGEFGMVQSTMGLFGVFSGFGLILTTTKYVAELKQKDPERAGRVIVLGTVVALVSAGLMAILYILLAPWLASRTMAAPHLTLALRESALLLVVTVVAGAQIGVLSGFEAFKTIAYINLWSSIAAVPATALLVYFGGLHGAVWAVTVSSAVGLWLATRAVGRECRRFGIRIGLGSDLWTEKAVLWNFSLPATLSVVVTTPAIWAANAILVNQSNGYGEMGVFNVANQWRGLLLFLPLTAGSVLLPILSNIRAENDLEEYGRVVRFNVQGILAVSFPICLLAICCSSLLARLYGKGFDAAVVPIQLLLFAAFLDVLGWTPRQVLISSERMWSFLAANCGWCGGLMAVTLIAAPRYGALGIAIAYVVAYVLQSAVAAWSANRVVVPGVFSNFFAEGSVASAILILAIVMPRTNSWWPFAGKVLLVVACAELVRRWLPETARQRIREILVQTVRGSEGT